MFLQGAAAATYRECVDQALADPRPDIPAREVFERLRERHRKGQITMRDEEV